MLHFPVKMKGLKNGACIYQSFLFGNLQTFFFFFFSEIRRVLLLQLTEVVTQSAAAVELLDNQSYDVIAFIYEDGTKCSAFEHG